MAGKYIAEYADVIIIGAGPTGLMLAVDLAQQGVSCIVLEERPRKRSNLTRAFSLHARTLDLLHIRGLADPIRDRAVSVQSIPFLWGLEVSFSEVPAFHREMLVVPQFEVEAVLMEHAQSPLVDIHYESTYIGHVDGPHSVSVSYRHNDHVRTVIGRFIVGADGSRSATRNQLDIQFPGKRVLAHAVLADAHVFPSPERPMVIAANHAGFVFMADFADGYHRIFGWSRSRIPDEAGASDFVYLQATCGDVMGRIQVSNPRWVSRFSSYESVADYYRMGRGFLVGDAAHVHSPAGGLGMNLGLQDSVNLGWKLARVIKNNAADGLLKSYESEMRPLAEAAVRSSGSMIHRATHRRGLRARIEDFIMSTLRVVPVTRNALERKLGEELSGSRLGLAASTSSRKLQYRDTGTFAADLLGDPTALEALRSHRYVIEEPRGTTCLETRYPGLPVGASRINPTTASDSVRIVRPDGYVERTIDESPQ
ncbi:FAD-dependent monooxygenase [Leucobacter sp. M11]|uniref:FAD-dependent monooxygenase n=1 Tax=Leucobacter sp. M11 TaxID=2993565 RepID=UPI002D7E3561|nr:FAD-dependent monooxygenase [Leucobacter sp. M11]MEB4613745.1 FAD-dependent monooxygenase [Leucobacter sp. M11]